MKEHIYSQSIFQHSVPIKNHPTFQHTLHGQEIARKSAVAKKPAVPYM